MTHHYWNIETSGLSRRRAEIAYRVFGLAVRLLGGEVAGGGYGDVPPVETIPAKTAIDEIAKRNRQYLSGSISLNTARIIAARNILGLTQGEVLDWITLNFPD